MSSEAMARSAGAAGALAEYRWEHRVLVVFAPGGDCALYRRQLEVLEAAEPGLQDRDVVVISVLAGNVATAGGPAARASPRDLRDAYDVLPHHFRVVLIGRDGRAKLHQEQPVSAVKLFALIGSMPMRKHETNRRSK
jgi:hypothetical protein